MKRQNTEVVKIMRGSTEVSKIYHGTSLYYDKNVHPDILLDYIANGPDSGTANKSVWYDTGVPIVNTSFLKAEIKTASNVSNQTWPLGGMNNASWAGFCFYAPYNQNSSGMYAFRVNNRTIGNGSSDFTANQPHVITGYLDKSDTSSSGSVTTYKPVLIVDGTEYRSTEYAGIPNQGMNIYLFTRNLQSGQTITGSPSGLKIYYAKIWDDNKLIRFYIPVLHFVNGQYVACFYDKVNDNYIYNLGTDTPEYSVTSDVLLDYLGTQPESAIPATGQVEVRYDTGVVASNKLAVDTRFRLIYGIENYLFGSGTSGSTSPSWQTYGIGYPGNLTQLRMNQGANSSNSIVITMSNDTSVISNVHRFSSFFDSSGEGLCYLDDTYFDPTTSRYSTLFSSQTIYLFSRHADTTVLKANYGSRIYFINFTTSNVPTKTLIPVLHNGSAAFLDLQSGNYLYNIGTRGIEYYVLKY